MVSLPQCTISLLAGLSLVLTATVVDARPDSGISNPKSKQGAQPKSKSGIKSKSKSRFKPKSKSGTKSKSKSGIKSKSKSRFKPKSKSGFKSKSKSGFKSKSKSGIKSKSKSGIKSKSKPGFKSKSKPGFKSKSKSGIKSKSKSGFTPKGKRSAKNCRSQRCLPHRSPKVTYLSQSDFDNGTLQITRSGVYRLTENISFNPHPPGSMGETGNVLDAYSAGLPFPSQLGTEPGQYDPAAFGVGFFAAIAISGHGVELDLNGYTIEQSATHALLQRFFAVIELADQPFLPNQGPAGFGDELVPATRITIKNGTIGRSAHHGIHGNANRHITVQNVDFKGFEVAAIALNGVKGLRVIDSHAENREDVPVIGTFSNARFIAPYLDWLVQSGSATKLTVQNKTFDAGQLQTALRDAVNNVYEDVIEDGEGEIDPQEHPAEYALFHNKFGIVDGNSYGYLVHPIGAAVGGFVSQPEEHARDIVFQDVHIDSQKAFVNEVVALQREGKPVLDPVGAVFMVRNTHPDTDEPVTLSGFDSDAQYTGNVLANAQALVAKAAQNGEFPEFLDVSRSNISPGILDWIESALPLSTIADKPEDYLCNGDTMFHVNKGVIGFRMDGVLDLKMYRTSAVRLENIGTVGSSVCGNYQKSHPDATLPGYGGAGVRGYSFAGSEYISVVGAKVKQLESHSGTIIGFDVLTDTLNVGLKYCSVLGLDAGAQFVGNGGPNSSPDAVGFQIGADTKYIDMQHVKSQRLSAFAESLHIRDLRTAGQ